MNLPQKSVKTLIVFFSERGPVEEILMDNARAFRSQEMEDLLEYWGSQPFYRAAYRAEGNGIVERNHRTVKASAERAGISPIQAVYWYNVSPRQGQRDTSVPQNSVNTYQWRILGQAVRKQEDDAVASKVQVGDEVWVKPGGSRCTTQWGKGRVTAVNSQNNVEVEGVPRHILDVRPVIERRPEGEGEGGTELDCEDDITNDGGDAERRRYPGRERQAPAWMQDYA